MLFDECVNEGVYGVGEPIDHHEALMDALFHVFFVKQAMRR